MCALFHSILAPHSIQRTANQYIFLSSLFIMCANLLFTGYCSNLSLKTEFWVTIMGIFCSSQCYKNQRFNKQWFNVFLQECFLHASWGKQGMKKLRSKACLFVMYKTLPFRMFIILNFLAFKAKPQRYFYVLVFWISQIMDFTSCPFIEPINLCLFKPAFQKSI